MEILYVTKVFPDAQRVQLDFLKERYQFTEVQLNEIRTHWIKDPNYTDYYCKPGSTYDLHIINPQSDN
tara:strand:- start:489 stop:692 length:204 start_codon:yes stop_codon:yes gene_type:complete